VVLANLVKQTPQQILQAWDIGDIALDSGTADKTQSIVRCVEYAHSNLSAATQKLLLCLSPFVGVFGNVNNGYVEKLQQQPVLQDLPFEQWESVVQEAQRWGLMQPHPQFSELLWTLQPILPFFLRHRLHSEPALPAAIATAFREYYDYVGNVLNQLLKSKEPQPRQLGLALTQIEFENLSHALQLALTAQVSIQYLYFPLDEFLDRNQQHSQGVALNQRIIKHLATYPPSALQGQMGYELATVTDHLAKHLLLLQQYAEAESAYQNNLRLFDQLVAFDREFIAKSKALTYHQLGYIAEQQRQWEQAHASYQQALQIKIEFNDRYAQAGTYHQLGMVAEEQRQWEQAHAYYQQALQIYVEFNDRYEQAGTYHQLGNVAYQQQQWEQAHAYYQQALQIFIDFNDKHPQATVYYQLGNVAFEQRQWEQAHAYYQQALQIKIEFNDRYAQASTYHQLGRVAQEQRQWEQAHAYYQQALQIKIEFNDRYEQARTYHQLGMVAQEQRQWEQARDYYLRALVTFAESNDPHNLRIALGNIKLLYQATQDAGLITAVAQLLERDEARVKQDFEAVATE